MNYEKFLEDIGNKPSDKHQLDRIDNNGNYCKENCRWVLPKINNRNQSKSKRWVINNICYLSSIEAAKFNNVSYQTIQNWCSKKKDNCFSYRIY